MNINAIFDAFKSMSAAVHRQDRINKKVAQIESAKAHRCGNCFKWMKSTCAPEKTTGIKKSMGSMGCSIFEYCPSSIERTSRLESELSEIKEAHNE